MGGVNRVFNDISQKPPATIRYEQLFLIQRVQFIFFSARRFPLFLLFSFPLSGGLINLDFLVHSFSDPMLQKELLNILDEAYRWNRISKLHLLALYCLVNGPEKPEDVYVYVQGAVSGKRESKQLDALVESLRSGALGRLRKVDEAAESAILAQQAGNALLAPFSYFPDASNNQSLFSQEQVERFFHQNAKRFAEYKDNEGRLNICLVKLSDNGVFSIHPEWEFRIRKYLTRTFHQLNMRVERHPLDGRLLPPIRTI